MLAAMGYPHWMIVAGALFIVLGFVGLRFTGTGTPSPKRSPPRKKLVPQDRPEERDRRANS
jgi:hypothetical protein